MTSVWALKGNTEGGGVDGGNGDGGGISDLGVNSARAIVLVAESGISIYRRQWCCGAR